MVLFPELDSKSSEGSGHPVSGLPLLGFLELLLAELRSTGSRDESEFLASLAILAVQGMDAKKYPTALKNDFLAGVWTEVANVRRIGSEWHHADVALRRAEQYLVKGTEDPLPRARTLSIAASLRAEQGQLSEAVELLERCRKIYKAGRDWTLMARTLVQMAYVLMESEWERGLALLDQAAPLIPAEDATLLWLAANLRTGGLIEAGQIEQALLVFQQAESLLTVQTRPNAKLRNTFTAARLLEALGRRKEAERLFEELIAEGLEREWYKDAFLDLLYLFGFHIRAGAAEKAVDVCRRALAQLELLELGHDQPPGRLDATEGSRRAAGADPTVPRDGPGLPPGALEAPGPQDAGLHFRTEQVKGGWAEVSWG
jgi:tetratricopeptide (TPR) repeat protein